MYIYIYKTYSKLIYCGFINIRQIITNFSGFWLLSWSLKLNVHRSKSSINTMYWQDTIIIIKLFLDLQEDIKKYNASYSQFTINILYHLILRCSPRPGCRFRRHRHLNRRSMTPPHHPAVVLYKTGYYFNSE